VRAISTAAPPPAGPRPFPTPAFGAPLSADQERHHSLYVQVRLDQNGNLVTYVSRSGVSYGGMATGTDVAACGTLDSPCASIEYGLTQTQTGGTIRVNGDPASPATYTVAASNLDLGAPSPSRRWPIGGSSSRRRPREHRAPARR
jgi:hypothetical protein